jgi:surfactin synthase thioesterase subunit
MKINLFCLPPAGSSTALFATWHQLVADNITIVPIEYPGHGTLVKQALTHSPEALTKHVVEKIQSYGDQPFILYGHSVGTAVAWRVEQAIRQTSLAGQLKLLVVSGRPELEYSSKMSAKRFLSREGLVRALCRYNAVPQELLQNDDAMDFFLTILRNDFHLNDNMLQDKIIQTNVPLMAFYGEDDPDIPSHQQMDAWQKHSTQWLGCTALAGEHFFFNNPESLKTMLNKICASVAA